jgi:hypothetical protein
MHPLANPADLLAALTAPARPGLDGEAAGAATHAAPPSPGGYVISALLGAGTLSGVPVDYLAPDPALLAPDDGPIAPDTGQSTGSIQFFVIDPRWVRALRVGMLAAGSSKPPDPAEATAVLARVVPDPPAPLTGLLLCSTLVADYPELAVRAWTGALGVDDDPEDPVHGAVAVSLLRCERITPGVLVVVFAAAPDVVFIEEPHGMVRLGVRRDQAGAPAVGVRTGAGTLVEVGGNAVEVTVPFRGDPADGVVDVAGLAGALGAAVAATPVGSRAPDPTSSPGALALQLLAPPARQRYQRGVR